MRFSNGSGSAVKMKLMWRMMGHKLKVACPLIYNDQLPAAVTN